MLRSKLRTGDGAPSGLRFAVRVGRGRFLELGDRFLFPLVKNEKKCFSLFIWFLIFSLFIWFLIFSLFIWFLQTNQSFWHPLPTQIKSGCANNTKKSPFAILKPISLFTTPPTLILSILCIHIFMNLLHCLVCLPNLFYLVDSDSFYIIILV